jgi:GT2 family glycosyltransferase
LTDAAAALRRALEPSAISVVTVTYNSSEVLGTALAAARRLLPNAELIVVDNGSSDTTVSLAYDCGATGVITGHGNVGFGAAVNIGARAANAPLLLVLNPDVELTDVDERTLDRLAAESAPGLLAGSPADHGRSSLPRRWGVQAELWWAIVTLLLVPRELALKRPTLGLHGAAVWVPGAAFIVSREEFLALGGFDERLFLYFEDVDLSKRYALHDRRVGVTSAFRFSHAWHASSPRDEDLMAACVLLSLVQCAANWESVARSERLAKSVQRCLRNVRVLCRALRWLPWVGPRATRKAASVDRIEAYLLGEADGFLPDGAYVDARAALSPR